MPAAWHAYDRDAQATLQAAKPGRRRRIVATYDYRDESGVLAFQVVRYDPKGFSQRRPGGAGGWTWNLNGTCRVLYRLPELVASREPIYICEGEKDADALAALGLTATTCAQGAGKWRGEYNAFLRGRDVVILPDNDQPGRAHAEGVAASLRSVAASVRIVALPSLPEKGDVSDWLAAGGTVERLRALVAEMAFNGADVADDGDATQAGDGAAVLDDVRAFLSRFVAYPSKHAAVAHALWIAHAHLMECWDTTPRLAFLSPEPASGKTRALEASELLVPNPVEAVNVSAAYLFRKVSDPAGLPTILFDEVDTVFGPKTKEHNEEVRGLLNAGYRRGAVAGRVVLKGKSQELVDFPAYCPVALAGLGDLPDTILTRSVIVRMRRRGPGERVEPFRRRVEQATGHALRDRLAAWARGVRSSLMDTWPTMPPGIEDRDADVWEALLAVADAAGADWAHLAREAALAFVAAASESTPSLGIRLLSDLRTAFGEADSLATEEIIKRLCAIEEAPWAEVVAGKPLNARGLANRLKPYGVSSTTLRIGAKTPKGYRRQDLADAWTRYIPPTPKGSATSATGATSRRDDAYDSSNGVARVADLLPAVADRDKAPTHEVADVAHVADFGLTGQTDADDSATASYTPQLTVSDSDQAAGAEPVPGECASPTACRHLGPCESGWCGRRMPADAA